MYPSSFNSTNQPRTSFYCYNNDTIHSKPPQEHYYPPSSSFHLHSPHYIPFEDEAIFCELFQQQQQPFSNDHNHDNLFVAHEHSSREINTSNVQSAMEKCCRNNGKMLTKDGDDDDHFNAHVEPKNSSPRMRTSKKDRHSKINTARGPRDRRMRLSLDVARKFFKLQDMLGFEKASKTVDWLITNSKTAIQELLGPQQLNRSSSFMGVSNSASSTSECEVLSGIDDQSVVKTGDDQPTTKCKSKSSSSSNSKEKKKIARGARKSANLHHPLAKETREKARARARDRTMEKRNNKLGCSGGGDQYSVLGPCSDPMDQDVNRSGNWSLFGENQVQTIDQPENPSSHIQFKQGIVGDHSSFMTGNWCPSFNYQNNPELSHEHQFNDLQMLSNLWEGNNN